MTYIHGFARTVYCARFFLVRPSPVHKIPKSVCGRNSVVECQLPKLDVVGSNPIARF
jgi:hypothetical protein